MHSITQIKQAKTGRCSSWDTSGRNGDWWVIPANSSRVLADIVGPGQITHIWMTQAQHLRECLIRITWDDAPSPSILVPLGDFFGLGNSIVNSYQSFWFSASSHSSHLPGGNVAFNSYIPMPFQKRALVELVNESDEEHMQFFYIDYETYASPLPKDTGYLHAEFRRENPFGGWGPEVMANTPEADIANKEETAWDNNYVILETKGRGHYVGCNLSVTNFQGSWWGEGDDMIWVDGYKWPPDLHGTGSEDYLNQAWGMQPNAFLRNGSSIHEKIFLPQGVDIWAGKAGGYQTSYVFHIENPVRFEREIKVTIEHGHGNHLANEVSSVAYWYADMPYAARAVPPVQKRMPVLRDEAGNWIHDPEKQTSSRVIELNDEMREMKRKWAKRNAG